MNMRKLLALLPVSLVAVAAFAQGPVASKSTAKTTAQKAVSAVPRRADEFVIHMTNGPDKLLSASRGSAVVLAFMYTTCPHCQHMAGVLAGMKNEYAAKGVQFLGVAFDAGARANVEPFIKLTGTNFPCGFSTPDQVQKFVRPEAEDFNIPILVFIDRAGMIRSQYVSYGLDSPGDKFLSADGLEARIHAEIDKLLKTPAAAAK
jgi:hypothetical protein